MFGSKATIIKKRSYCISIRTLWWILFRKSDLYHLFRKSHLPRCSAQLVERSYLRDYADEQNQTYSLNPASPEVSFVSGSGSGSTVPFESKDIQDEVIDDRVKFLGVNLNSFPPTFLDQD
jgi:hypothetical protein